MQLLKLVVLLTSSLLFIACNGPETSSSNGDFFNLGLPSTHNKLSDEDEKKAHDIVAMVEDSLASVNEQKYAEGLELKQYFKVGEYQPSDFRSEVRATCQLERKQESSRTAGKAIEYRWSENSQKSTRHLEVSKGEELIPCPINLAVTESSLGG
ncbi:MAG: hypothetical protein KDD40_07930, partial [Bdellovibrionales bacterium]|nr:hypothetical protein [Bdellovibrionales bacterium]